MKTTTGIAIAFAVMTLLGCAPADAPPTDEGVPEGLENGSFTAQLNGFDIHYEVYGQGPVLMVVTNSWGLSVEGLRGLLGALEERLTMVYFDPRGMGESAEIMEESDMGMAAVRADFHALREHLGLERVSAIGWSNGAMNLIMLAAERPETIENAIFLHGAASFTEEDSVAYAEQYPEVLEAWRVLLQELENPDLTNDQRTEKMRAMWLGEWFPVSFADPAAAPEILDRIFDDAEFSWAHADYSQREHPEFDARNLLPQITARSLVITGAHDAMPVSKGEEMAAGIPNAEFVLFEFSGHYAPAEEPDAFEGLIYQFLGVN